jgi:hypothetical protein
VRQSNGKDFEENYWQQLHEWFERGGDQIVANYLHSLDSSSFDPKAPPQQTPAFWEIVEPREYPRMPNSLTLSISCNAQPSLH